MAVVVMNPRAYWLAVAGMDTAEACELVSQNVKAVCAPFGGVNDASVVLGGIVRQEGDIAAAAGAMCQRCPADTTGQHRSC